MQSWSNAGQNGTDDHGSWQQNYDFAPQNGQFDHNQNWSQPMVDQGVYSHINNADGASSNFFDAQSQQGSFLQGDLHASPNQPAFHGGHDSIPMGQQFSQPGQQVVDPTFHNMHPDLYSQQGKLNMNEGINHLGRVQSNPHAHSQPFTQHEFAYTPQNDQSFTPPVAQYNQPQLVAQQSRQQSHTPVQQFHPEFAQNHAYSRPPQPSPVQQPQHQSPASQQPQPQQQPKPHQQQQQQQQQQQPYPHQNQAYPHQLNGHAAQYDHNSHLAYQQPQQPYNQPSFTPQKPHAFQQAGQAPTNHQLQHHFPHQQPNFAAGTHVPPHPAPAQYSGAQQPADLEAVSPEAPQQEPTPKKRKRATKAVAEPVFEPVAVSADSPAESTLRRPDEIDAFEVPAPNAAEAQLMAQFAKRNKTAQARYPSIAGLPHLVYDGSVKLPAPKSYDKLAPLVALPPQSGKQLVPELGYDLPCEVQGKFTSQYRPSATKLGLDDRRDEAKSLLDEFDRSMNALGKRRPKYTEYPHAFKEQLKADEASKNKAEKKAKKELEEEKNKPIRPPTRPSDHVGAAVWDAIGIVHIEPSTPRTSSLIAGRVQQAGDFFIKLRGEMTRAKADLDQATKDKVNEAELAKLKQEADQKKEALYSALDATIEHADDGVLDNLGGHQKLILSLVNVLIGCIKASDFSGKLPKIVLELFTNFRMTKKIAETTNFDTVRKRFADKGDDEVKELVRELSQKIKKALKAAESETGYSGTSAAGRAKAATKPAADSSSTKRGRDEEPEARTVKKVAVESSSNSLLKKLGQSKPQAQPAAKGMATKARPLAKPALRSDDAARHSPTPPIEDKAKLAVGKADAGQVSAAKSEAQAAAARSAPSSSSSALSNINSLLASINAPKTEPLAKIPKDIKDLDTAETPEQRAKRLRKEARRKLRVSWKPEDELVQVKIFQKDDQEDEGREDSMIRDAADDRSEGMVLKQRADVEDEDDDDDIPYQPWLDPTPTDFSSIPEAVRDKNYVTRGGKVTFSTEEQRRIAEREQRELMVIYTDPADIPPTPKSPPPEASVGNHQGKIGSLPREDPKYAEIQLRWRDEQQMGVDAALYAATKRLEAKEGPSGKLDSIMGRLKGTPSSSSTPYQATAATHAAHPTALSYQNVPLAAGPPAEEQVLAWLASEQLRNWHEPEPVLSDIFRPYQYMDPASDAAGKSIEAVARSLAGKPFPANSPPEWLSNDQERVREWWLGYNKESQARNRKMEEERARAEAEANALRAAAAAAAPVAANAPLQGSNQDWSAFYAQQPQYAQYMAILQQMTGGQQPGQAPAAAAPAVQSSLPDDQLQSILAAINQPAGQAQAPNQANYLNPNDPSYQQLSMLMQMAQGQQNTDSQANSSYAADRDWDRNDGYGRGDGHKDGKKKKATLPPHKPANKALIGTKPCTFWQQGKCARGDKCTFRHD